MKNKDEVTVDVVTLHIQEKSPSRDNVEKRCENMCEIEINRECLNFYLRSISQNAL